MKRLFIAIKIHPDQNFLKLFEELKESLNHEKIKWVEKQNLHLTLKFFGETQEEKIPEIIRAIKRSIAGHKQFAFDIENAGIFGSSYNPKVIWAGISNPEHIIKLEKSIQFELREIGYEPDRQNFVPHLTLGRVKYLNDKKLFQAIIKDFKNEFFQEVRVSELLLLESTLTKQGPIYSVVEKFILQA